MKHKLNRLFTLILASLICTTLTGCSFEEFASKYLPFIHTGTEEVTNKDFEGITFVDQSFDYDGREHAIYASYVPEFATVTYDNNAKIDMGTYIATATITAEGYEEL